jgi:hypothetical protein
MFTCKIPTALMAKAGDTIREITPVTRSPHFSWAGHGQEFLNVLHRRMVEGRGVCGEFPQGRFQLRGLRAQGSVKNGCEGLADSVIERECVPHGGWRG